jgi:UDP-N-acetylglucosamine 2-epimerase (non-hydrolysing)
VILMTGHRHESFDGGLARICQAMARVALRRDVAIVFPVHPNPNVRRATEPLQRQNNVLLVEPVDYPELVLLLKRCHFVVTDSDRLRFPRFPSELDERGTVGLRPHTHRRGSQQRI